MIERFNQCLGELRMTPIFAFSYATSFAAIAAVIVHTILHNGKKTIILEWLTSFQHE